MYDLKNTKNPDSKWTYVFYTSSWKIGSTAGGKAPETYWSNPQFLIELKDVDLYDDENKATIIIGLMQKESLSKEKNFHIHFRLYKVTKNNFFFGGKTFI